MTKRVAIFESASCCGWCLVYEADDYQQLGVLALATWWNTVEQWQKRNCDATAYIYDTVNDAVAAHTVRGWESPVADLESLMAFYDDDGQSAETSLQNVLMALVSDPANPDGEWPLVA